MVDENKDFDQDTVHVCDVYGYTLTGALEYYCPICKVHIEMFITFIINYYLMGFFSII